MEPVNRYPTLDKKPDNFIPTLENLKNGQILRKKKRKRKLELFNFSAQNRKSVFNTFGFIDFKLLLVAKLMLVLEYKPGSAQNLN